MIHPVYLENIGYSFFLTLVIAETTTTTTTTTTARCQEKAEVKGKHGGKTLGKNVSATGQTWKQRLSVPC